MPSAELRAGGDLLATSGSAAGPTTTIALRAGEDHVGDLVVGLPEHHRDLPRATEHVLRLVAAPLARALRSAQLAEELQRSRHEVVVASEEERRRIRRELHDLPAATEVAAYRLVVEALHNVVRHGDATRAHVTVAVAGGELALRVTDDGPARDVPWSPGVGLTSMRERVEQLGGGLRAGPSDTGGEVHAVLPLADVPQPSGA